MKSLDEIDHTAIQTRSIFCHLLREKPFFQRSGANKYCIHVKSWLPGLERNSKLQCIYMRVSQEVLTTITYQENYDKMALFSSK